jgi:uncharacterized protein (TIGR03437 family)
VKSILGICVVLISNMGYAQSMSVASSAQAPGVGGTFSVDISVAGIADLYAFQFDFAFDPKVLSVVSVTESTFLPGGGPTIFIPGSIDNTGGTVAANADTLIGAIGGVTGSGALAHIQFTALAPGTSALSLQNLIVLNSKLSDITVSSQNGYVTIVPTAITSGGVVPLYSSTPIIQPGSWVSIYGSNLAPEMATWNADFPTSLAGVSVTIDNKSAYLWYVSPTQINLQAPDDTATGSVNVVVTTPGGTATSTVTLSQFGPSFSLFNGKYAAGVIPTPNGGGAYGNGTYDLLGPSGAFSFSSRPVRTGEILELYGTGFGPTNPSVPAGQLFSGAAPTVNTVAITIGGVSANVMFAGITEAGLYQFNVVVPTVSAGDQLLQATVGGVQTQGNIYVTVQ